MFTEMGLAKTESEKAALDASITALHPWLEQEIARGRYFGFLVQSKGFVAGGIGLMLINWPPHPYHPHQLHRGYILNLFIEPRFRRHGLATRLMQLGEEEFRRRDIHYLVLHASEQGRPVYEQLGWSASPEMIKRLD